ncbi:MAG TPA: Asp-tRNA(Asn)/Glu-tRNA(Gln) amidotransferase subunit GatC [Syntrophales bacterium]|nr:Asp-tRNA(Asn)/Glu-tRNA(Gln) amidotransferase subunit GatC [Syntrophales bacterium]HOL58852.1 Asp-tRNA(Asn)/Glu-tRNA(Gln) amidotransferase subunit GatC [Syntrophales bacterium]HPO35179.1 Asp-tRNA(Asn)/Glu-tRNA(Gln) amidotransferase subunit GatC [Syntrophales bacterium]
MKISRSEVMYVAHLARLELTDEEAEKFTSQLNDILLYMEKLNSVDTKDVEPMSHAISLHNAFRADKVEPSLANEVSLANAPDSHGEFFRVPKVID